MVGERSEQEATDMVLLAKDYSHVIVGVGMATCEEGIEICKFKRAYKVAQELGLKTTAHFWDEKMSLEI